MQEGFFSQVIELGQSSTYNLSTALSFVKTNLQDRYKVVDYMAESLVLVSIPHPYRYFIYLAEQAEVVPKTDQEKADIKMKEDSLKVPEHIKALANEILKNDENRKFLQNSAIKLRKSVKKLYASNAKIQRRVLKLDQFFCEQVIPKVTPNVFVNFFKWVNSVFLSFFANEKSLLKSKI